MNEQVTPIITGPRNGEQATPPLSLFCLLSTSRLPVTAFLRWLPVANVVQGQPEFVGVVLQQALVRLPRRVAELGVDLGVPLVNPGQELIEARQDGGQPLGVPALPLAGIVVADEGGRLLEVVPPRPADDQAWVALGLEVG